MNASFDTSINVSVAANKQQFVIKMKSPQDLFYIDNNYTYAGQVTKGFEYISYFRWLYLHEIHVFTKAKAVLRNAPAQSLATDNVKLNT